MLPLWLGVEGIWLSVPVAEAVTAAVIGLTLLPKQSRKARGSVYQINT